MHRLIWFVPLALILAIVMGRLFYYNGFGSSYAARSPVLPEPNFEAFAKSAPHLEAADDPTVSQGVVAVDYAHNNALLIEELNVLFSKIVSRGFTYEIILKSSTEVSSDKDKTAASTLAGKLRYAQALILPLPRVEYTDEEIAEIKSFVRKGGRVLIIGDPTRTIVVEALNSIAGSFGIIYANDYLYSLENNDHNYRHVVYTHFKESPLTKGLGKEGKVIFYGGGSLSAPGHEIILGDETTRSNVSEGGRVMAAAALTTGDRVLALGDLTFLNEPYSAAESNGILINNMADFLTGGKRDFGLKDFPFFLNAHVDLVYDNSLVLNSQFDHSIKLKEFLEKNDRTVTFSDKIGGRNDVIFVGRFDEAKPVQEFLADGGITILGLDEADNGKPAPQMTDKQREAQMRDTPPGEEEGFITGRIRLQGVGDLERGGSTLFYLDQKEGRNVLIILSDTPKTNAAAFKLLLDNKLSECRLNDTSAVCQTQRPDGKLPPSQRSRRIDNILVVSSDSGRPGADKRTGVIEFTNALSHTYHVDAWPLSEKGSLDVAHLLEYDAVIWTTGSYWDDSIDADAAALLSKYIEVGGNLILSGAFIGFDWDHTDFLTQVAHADYLDFAEQRDLKVTLPNHPIAAGFATGSTISFTETFSSKDEIRGSDVISNTPNAQVIFQRGPKSKLSGAASVVAYEDDRVKIAYFAFPIYWLPAQQRNGLINNTVGWFSQKSLPRKSE